MTLRGRESVPESGAELRLLGSGECCGLHRPEQVCPHHALVPAPQAPVRIMHALGGTKAARFSLSILDILDS